MFEKEAVFLIIKIKITNFGSNIFVRVFKKMEFLLFSPYLLSQFFTNNFLSPLLDINGECLLYQIAVFTNRRVHEWART